MKADNPRTYMGFSPHAFVPGMRGERPFRCQQLSVLSIGSQPILRDLE